MINPPKSRKRPSHAPASVPKFTGKANAPKRNRNTGRARNGRRRTTGNPLLYDSERTHLTALEIQRLIEATQGSRNEARDRCLLLLMFRHGLRVSEACRLRLGQVDTQSRMLHIVRLKHGLSTTQPLRGANSRQSAHGSSNAPA
jgi:integrase